MANADVSALRTYADSQADSFGIPRDIFENLISQESGWNPNAKGSAGEEGIAQLMPGTAPNINRFDPFASMNFAASLLKQYYDKFGSWSLALAAYNAGPGAVTKGNIPSSTQSYIASILGKSGVTTTGASLSPGGTREDIGAPSMSAAKVVFWAAVVIVLVVVIRGVVR